MSAGRIYDTKATSYDNQHWILEHITGFEAFTQKWTPYFYAGKEVGPMGNYDVQIHETLEMIVSVEAANMNMAKKIVEQKWRDSEYVLDSSHFKGVSISPLYPYNREYAR